MAAKISSTYPKSFGFHNLAQDGDRISDFYHRFASECCSREIDVLILTVSGNDLIRSPNPDSAPDLSEHLRNEYWHKLLDLAQKNIKTIVVLDSLPIREEIENEDETDVYQFNKDIEEYNKQIEKVCSEKNIPFIKFYNKWAKRNLADYYVDATHPNGAGHQLIADEVFEELQKLGILG